MNIVVQEDGPERTRVIVQAKYVLRVTERYEPYQDRRITYTYVFESGGYATVRLQNRPAETRTMVPTYKAEQAILDAIENL